MKYLQIWLVPIIYYFLALFFSVAIAGLPLGLPKFLTEIMPLIIKYLASIHIALTVFKLNKGWNWLWSSLDYSKLKNWHKWIAAILLFLISFSYFGTVFRQTLEYLQK